MTPKIKIRKKSGRKSLKKRKSWKKRTRGNCVAEAFQYQQYCTGQHSSKTQKNSSFRRFLKKSLWNHLKNSETFTNRSGLKNQYQRWVSCTLFVGRMTISLKNTEISTRFSIFQGADFRNFRKSRFFNFWPLHPIQFFARIFTVATRNWFDEANDGLWPNYIFYKIFVFFWFFQIFLRMQKTWENIAKSAGNANLPRIPRVYVEGHTA